VSGNYFTNFQTAIAKRLPDGIGEIVTSPYEPVASAPQKMLPKLSVGFSHKSLTGVSNFDQTCEQYRTDAQFAPEYK
jgi:hypothetical protein